MWVFTLTGFYSVVRKPNETKLQVRARVKEDLERLRLHYCPNLGEIFSTPNGDYPFRALVTPEDWAATMAKISMDITYSNFKHEVELNTDAKRAGILLKVWLAMRGLEAPRVYPKKDNKKGWSEKWRPFWSER